MSSIVFLFNLVQDVSIIRPLAYLVRRETDHEIVFLVSHGFLDRDRQKIWQRELGQLRADIGAEMSLYATALDAFTILQSRHGFLVAASESSLSGHMATHDVFRAASQGFVRVTLQHGYECVGFLQNREHNLAHGLNVTFAADVLCGWSEAPILSSMPLSERSKLYVTGPSTVLQRGGSSQDNTELGGIVCENLHSVRLRASGDHGASFMEVFGQFCDAFRDYGLPVTLRPHPGGQYVLKNNVPLLDNVTINNRPIYRANLSSYMFGISAPSTVLLDMLLAGIPTALWHDEHNVMDFSNYEGLTSITTLSDWIAFVRDAVLRRDALIAGQQDFLDRLAMPLNPTDVYARFARLFASGASGPAVSASVVSPLQKARRRVLFIANGLIPTLQLSFLKPLEPYLASGDMEIATIFETDISAAFGLDMHGEEARGWMVSRIEAFEPTLIVCCRYSGPQERAITDTARRLGIPIVFHIDDDLLNIPPELGARKYKSHNRPERLRTVDHLLVHSSLIYCSTAPLKRRLRHLGYTNRITSGAIYCAGQILTPALLRPVTKIGYMGFDHAHDFAIVLPQLVVLLQKYEDLKFELFGSIPLPDALKIFGDRVTVIEPVADYSAFMEKFAELNWDIGLCPLALTPFNAVKANTKWIEYTSVGAAVIATSGMAYDDCCDENRGILAADHEWLEALEYLVNNPAARFEMVERAQTHLRDRYGRDRLREQILTIFNEAEELLEETTKVSKQMWGGRRKWAEWSISFFGHPENDQATMVLS